MILRFASDMPSEPVTFCVAIGRVSFKNGGTIFSHLRLLLSVWDRGDCCVLDHTTIDLVYKCVSEIRAWVGEYRKFQCVRPATTEQVDTR